MKIPTWAVSASVIIALATTATATWVSVTQVALEGPEPMANAVPAQRTAESPASETAVAPASVAPASTDALAAHDVTSAPTGVESRLPHHLQLMGIFANADSAQSIALIAPRGAQGKSYHIDEVVHDDWRLVEIDSTAVTLQKDDRRLRLELSNGNRSAEPPTGNSDSRVAMLAAPNSAAAQQQAPADPRSGYRALTDGQIRSELTDKLNALRAQFETSQR